MALEAKRKRARASGAGGGFVGDPDRLSALPDCLLHAIMSFMKARQAVQTCVLSTRWRHLWHSVPCLDVDLDEFKAEQLRDPESTDKDWEDFEDFAVNLMLHCNIALLDSFKLCLSRCKAPNFGSRLAGGWLRRAMRYCTTDPGIQRDDGLGSCSWRLKRLHLCNVALDNRFAKHVSSVCHSLEDLELRDCTCALNAITSHSMKNLVLESCRCSELSEITMPALKSLVINGSSNANDCLLVIFAPAVTYLVFSVRVGNFDGGISINEMPSLAKASIHLWGARLTIQESIFCSNPFKLLCSLSNVTSLQLTGLGTMVLGEESTTFRKFNNMKDLFLFSCDLSDDFQTLGLFLQNSPNLEKLTLWRCKFSNVSKKKKGKPIPKDTSSSQCCSLLDSPCENLKFTKIVYKEDDVRQLVELLLLISGKLPKNNIKLVKVD